MDIHAGSITLLLFQENVSRQEAHVGAQTLRRVLGMPALVKHINSYLLSYEVLENMLALRTIKSPTKKSKGPKAKTGRAGGRYERKRLRNLLSTH